MNVRTFAVSSCGVPVGVGRAGRQTRSIVQRSLRVLTCVTVIAAWPVAQSAVRVATQTLPERFVLEEPFGTVQHAQAVVEEVILLATCEENSVQNEFIVTLKS